MKAVVMAGGEGTRLRPMTSDLPKPLLPVADRPIMEHVLRLLGRHGLRQTVVTVQYLAARIQEQFGDGSELGMELSYAKEEEPLGTAGSVKNAARQLGGEPFLVISGDALTDIDLGDLIRFHRQNKALVTVCLTRVPDPLEFGITITDPDGRVERFLEKPTWGQVFSDTVNTGIYVMEPQVLDLVPEGEPCDWSSDVFPRLLAEGGGIYGYVAEGYWEDVGTHAAYLKAQSDVLEGQVRVEREGTEVAPGVFVDPTASVDATAVLTAPLHIGAHAQIGPGTRLTHTVVGRHAVIDTGAALERAVIHPHAYAGPRTQLRGCVVGRGATLRAEARLAEGSVLGANCVMEEDSALTDDVLVYPGKTIEAHTTVTDSLIWESRGTKTLFTPSGVSGTLGSEITVDLAVRLAGAYATLLRRGAHLALARDLGQGGQILLPAMTAALRASGVTVRDLGHVPLPLARAHTAEAHDGAILLTTSPTDPAGVDIRFLDATGTELAPARIRTLQRVFNRREYRRVLAGETGALDTTPLPLHTYAHQLTTRLTTTAGVGAGPRMRVVIDTAHGSAALTLPAVLGQLGIDALCVNNTLEPPAGAPPATPDQELAALHRLGALVSAQRAAFGIRIDPAAERLHLVDERGRPLSEEQTLLLMCDLTTAHYGGGLIALPVTATRAAERCAAAHLGQIRRIPTTPGELTRAATHAGTILAADGQGRFVLPAFSLHPDAVAAFVRLTHLLHINPRPLSELTARLPRAHVRHRDIPTAWQDKGLVMRSVVEHAGARAIDTTDGVRVIEADGSWTLVLPDSATATTRLWAEGPDAATTDALLDHWHHTVTRTAS
ncbi:sugar phosphate nucleotidyltransferase [Streptomyces purpureus]|nr:sugar phosphate nucleotidyltransferase [Streptomyces purpureus]